MAATKTNRRRVPPMLASAVDGYRDEIVAQRGVSVTLLASGRVTRLATRLHLPTRHVQSLRLADTTWDGDLAAAALRHVVLAAMDFELDPEAGLWLG